MPVLLSADIAALLWNLVCVNLGLVLWGGAIRACCLPAPQQEVLRHSRPDKFWLLVALAVLAGALALALVDYRQFS